MTRQDKFGLKTGQNFFIRFQLLPKIVLISGFMSIVVGQILLKGRAPHEDREEGTNHVLSMTSWSGGPEPEKIC
ncbi:MAG: hypothetical protein CL574_11040 [Altererythrobacter sp.]|nr:hypothetical protein [Altererythrobacter sp.]|tara:strand:+ start:403 stop:624 length:222 start_codon:yes stop_codon:yes gene_type:complete